MKKKFLKQIKRANLWLNTLYENIYGESRQLTVKSFVTPEPIKWNTICEEDFQKINLDEMWGKKWECGYFILEGTIPDEWKGQKIIAQLNFGGEACVVEPDGTPILGLTQNSIYKYGKIYDILKEDHTLCDSAIGGEKIKLRVEATASGFFGVTPNNYPAGNKPMPSGKYVAYLEKASLRIYHEPVFQLFCDALVLIESIDEFEITSPRHCKTLNILIDAMNYFVQKNSSTEEVRRILAPALQFTNGSSMLKSVAVGNAHLDVGWLWPISETIRKAGRAFSYQLMLMDKYPDFVFGASQAQVYEFVKDNYPVLYERIKQRIKEGRWEIHGGMWVEPDCNIPNGESLIRQILYGKAFFKEEFGKEINNLWLPDVFGYSAALPQIMKKTGITTFLTQKLSWNEFNPFPHNTFYWEGIDGSKILTHFPPEDTYVSNLSPKKLKHGYTNFSEKSFLDEYLTLFGIGDGGGGPNEIIIERGLRQKNLENSPKIRFGTSQEFFDNLKKNCRQLQTWTGELYFEHHRGTYTTQSETKAFNRSIEKKFRLVELLYSSSSKKYPHEMLDRCWKDFLTLQFHDILPGTSIKRVYDEAKVTYLNISDKLNFAVDSLIDVSDKQKISIVNPHSFPVKGFFEMKNRNFKLVDSDSEMELDFQTVGNKIYTYIEIEALSKEIFLKKPFLCSIDPKNSVSWNKKMETDLLILRFNDNMEIEEIFDKELNKNILVENSNVFSLYHEDSDAWDIDFYTKDCFVEKAELIDFENLSAGPYIWSIKLHYKIGHSHITQMIILKKESKKIDFRTEVNWKESNKMLRVRFDLDMNAREYISEIQYGELKKHTAKNTSWDQAKFEIPFQRYIDLRDSTFGVALLNDSKYGISVGTNFLDLNLLRSTHYPDPTADIGFQKFNYSILPHTDTDNRAEVFKEAVLLNQPLFSCDGDIDFKIPVTFSSESVYLEVVKKSQNDKSIIIRLYELFGNSTEIDLNFETSCFLYETDMLENPFGDKISPAGNLKLKFTPFEIRTFSLSLDKEATK